MTRSTARTIALLGLVALFAAAVVARGLDRISEFHPDAAQHVPAAFRVYAARIGAREALAANRSDAALVEAKLAVLHDPVDGRSLGLLGSVLLASGNAQAADDAFTVSAALGWREPATQLYWMGQALQLGDIKVASQRLDALLRQNLQYDRRQALLGLLEATPQGQAELAARLADGPAWAHNYFFEHYLQTPTVRRNRAAVGDLLAAMPGGRNCPLVAPLTFGLVTDGDVAAARRLWELHCRGAGGQALVVDGGFDNASQAHPLTAFDWIWPEDAGVGVTLAPASGFSGQAVNVSSSAMRERSFARQIMMLAPGSYSVSWRAISEAGEPATGIGVSLACAEGAVAPLSAILTDRRAGRSAAAFDVAAGCPAQWLSLVIAPGTGNTVLDNVAVVRR